MILSIFIYTPRFFIIFPINFCTHISYYNYFQMVIEVVDNLNWESPIIFYSQDQDIVLWQDFKSRGFLQPQFIKIPQFDDVAGQKLLKILLGVKHKRASTTLNLILFVDQLHIATAFLQSIEFFCLLFSRKKSWYVFLRDSRCVSKLIVFLLGKI